MNLRLIKTPRKVTQVLLAYCLASTSFSVDALTFADAYQKLLENNLSYRRAQLDFQADKTLVPQTRANLLPNLSVSGSTGYVRNDIERLEDPEAPPESAQAIEEAEDELDLDGKTRRREEYAIRLRQPIYNRTLSTRLKQAKSGALESELRLQRVLEGQLQALTDAYLGYSRATADMGIAKQELQSVNDHRILTIERQKIGLGTMADVHEAVSRYKIAQVELLEDVKSRELFADRLRRLLQLNQGTISAKQLNFEALNIAPKESDIQKLINDFLESNIEVELQRRVLKSAKLALRLDKSDRLPTIDLTGSSGRSKTEALEVGDERSTRDERIMLEVNIPIFSGFGKSAKIRESRFRYQAEEIELENTIASQKEVIAEAYRSKQTAYKKMLALEESFTSSNDALELRKEGYLEGIVSSLDVLNAYRDKHRAERSWKAASFEYLNEIVRLNIALGNVELKDVRKIDGYLTPQGTFQKVKGDKQNTQASKQNDLQKVVSLKTLNEEELREFISHWEEAWEQGDINQYLSFYSNEFQPNRNVSFKDWKKSREDKVIPEKQINLVFKDINIRKLLSEKTRYEVEFTQKYRSKGYSDQSTKVLLIEKVGKVLKIYSEKSI